MTIAGHSSAFSDHDFIFFVVGHLIVSPISLYLLWDLFYPYYFAPVFFLYVPCLWLFGQFSNHSINPSMAQSALLIFFIDSRPHVPFFYTTSSKPFLYPSSSLTFMVPKYSDPINFSDLINKPYTASVSFYRTFLSTSYSTPTLFLIWPLSLYFFYWNLCWLTSHFPLFCSIHAFLLFPI